MRFGGVSTNLPPPSRPRTSVPRVRYEAIMARAIPLTLILSSIYFVHTSWEYVLVPWLGRLSFLSRGLLVWCVTLGGGGWLSFYYARTTDPGSVPSEMGEYMRRAPPEMRTDQNYCLKCENVKPPRAHHCQRCKRCVLRMDHHCVTLNNCIGLYNYKYFISTFFYFFLSTMSFLLVMVARFIFHPEFTSREEKWNCIAYTLMCIVYAYISYKHTNMHLNLAMLNLTTIEYMQLPAHISLNFCQRYGIKWSRISNFDKGWRHNLIMLFGEPWITWFMPWVTPRSPWGPHPVTWYSGYSLDQLYGPPPSAPRQSGPRVNAHNHNTTAPRNPWAMYDEPEQHALEGLRATKLTGQGSLPLIAFEDDESLHKHAHGGGGGGDHGHSHGGDHGHSHGDHGHSHGGDDDDMPPLLSEEELRELRELQEFHHSHGGTTNSHGHSHGGAGHNHSHGGGSGGHNHSHGDNHSH